VSHHAGPVFYQRHIVRLFDTRKQINREAGQVGTSRLYRCR
jgi:hypothetical protein